MTIEQLLELETLKREYERAFVAYELKRGLCDHKLPDNSSALGPAIVPKGVVVWASYQYCALCGISLTCPAPPALESPLNGETSARP